jgi:hypothetical protein
VSKKNQASPLPWFWVAGCLVHSGVVEQPQIVLVRK